jgi:dTDP-4-dehydrorhamnose 3,5-epimerase
MELVRTEIEGVLLIKTRKNFDNRGSFTKVVDLEVLIQLNFTLREIFYSTSFKDVIRGMHFQAQPFETEKIVLCTSGKILDVVLDIRKNSSTLGKTLSTELSEENGFCVYVPKGVAHGFKTISKNADVLYLQSQDHSKEHDSSIHYDSFGFNWGVENPILSQRDLQAKRFSDYLSCM